MKARKEAIRSGDPEFPIETLVLHSERSGWSEGEERTELRMTVLLHLEDELEEKNMRHASLREGKAVKTLALHTADLESILGIHVLPSTARSNPSALPGVLSHHLKKAHQIK